LSALFFEEVLELLPKKLKLLKSNLVMVILLLKGKSEQLLRVGS